MSKEMEKLRTLASTLRENPPGDWNYYRKANCALGVARQIFEVEEDQVQSVLGLTEDQHKRVFFGRFDHEDQNVPPEVIADRIDELLAIS